MATTTTTPASRVVADEVLARLARMRQSRVWLSTATGIPMTTLHRRLNAQSPFTIDELAIIASALGTSLVELVASSAPPGAVVAA